MKKWISKWILPALLALGLVYGIKYIYKLPRYSGGDQAPGFEAVLAGGQQFRLSDLEGQYVLLDFWGSWCGPCRAENRQWVALYSTLKGASFSDAKGFTIVNIGVERKPESWERAIVMDQLDWPYHILDQSSSLRFFMGPLARLYAVRELPSTFFLGPQGQIIGRNWTPVQIADYLQKRLTK